MFWGVQKRFPVNTEKRFEIPPQKGGLNSRFMSPKRRFAPLREGLQVLKCWMPKGSGTQGFRTKKIELNSDI